MPDRAISSSPGDLVERPFIQVAFQRGFPPEVGVNGCRVEDVLQVAIERLERFQQGPLACVENEDALRALIAARSALESRIRRRREQGVLNTVNPHRVVRTEDEHEDFSATGA